MALGMLPLCQGHLRNSSHSQTCRAGCRSHLPEGISQGSRYSETWLQHSWCLVWKDSRPLL